jgi:hypothetical protein
MVDSSHGDGDAGLDYAQLFEALERRQSGVGQRVPPLEHAAAVGVEADVLPVEGWFRGEQGVAPVAGRGHRRAAEVDRPPAAGLFAAVGLSPGREDRFHAGWIAEVIGPPQRGDESGHAGFGAAMEKIDGGIDGGGCEFRLVSLYVHDHIGGG